VTGSALASFNPRGTVWNKHWAGMSVCMEMWHLSWAQICRYILPSLQNPSNHVQSTCLRHPRRPLCGLTRSYLGMEAFPNERGVLHEYPVAQRHVLYAHLLYISQLAAQQGKSLHCRRDSPRCNPNVIPTVHASSWVGRNVRQALILANRRDEVQASSEWFCFTKCFTKRRTSHILGALDPEVERRSTLTGKGAEFELYHVGSRMGLSRVHQNSQPQAKHHR
jgi:hypothetical protein